MGKLFKKLLDAITESPLLFSIENNVIDVISYWAGDKPLHEVRGTDPEAKEAKDDKVI
jgi:hypothetical protein